MNKKLIISALIFLGLTIIFLVLQLANGFFSSLAMLSFAGIFAVLGVYFINQHLKLKKYIVDSYDLYLTQQYSLGRATAYQVEEKDKLFFKEHKKNFKGQKLVSFGKIVFAFSIAISLIVVFFAKL